MHAGGIWCKTKIQIDHGGLEVNFSLQEPVELASAGCFYIDETSIRVYNIAIVIFLRTHIVSRIFGCFAVAGRAWTACFDIEVDNQH